MAEAEGIPPTASVASPGLGLRYVEPNYCYAYSGSYQANNTSQTVLDFTSGEGTIFGKIELYAAAKFVSPGDGGQTTCQVAFNGEVITVMKAATEGGAHGFGDAKCNVVIPPFTNVVIQVDSNEDTALELVHVILTGRVYGVV